MTNDIIEVEHDDLYELYNILADATTAASTGDPNTCAAKAAEAKRYVSELAEGSR